MAGTLDIAGMAILASSLAWCIERQGEAICRLHTALPHEPQDTGYLITAENIDHAYPAYWTARAPGGVELAAGAGDLNLAKCIKACEKHFQQLQTSAAHSPQR